ncbi:MAG: hypothetical protein ACE5KA_01085 [Nitrososphaerales archaeon]
MAKYDSIRGQELMEVEEKGNEITMIFKDNRYLFVKAVDGNFLVDRAQYPNIKGKELAQVEEKENELILIFNDGNFRISVASGKLVTDAVPE